MNYFAISGSKWLRNQPNYSWSVVILGSSFQSSCRPMLMASPFQSNGRTWAFALRQAKATTQSAWARDWQRAPRKGRFAIPNRIPPSLNPTKHLIELQNQRKVFSCLVQCRTGHAYTGEFRKQFFPEKIVDCECGETPQTGEHTIKTCDRYEAQRTKFRAEYRELALPELLGNPKGTATLSEFIRDSGAFTFTGEKYTPKGLPTFFEEPGPPDIDSEEDDSNAEQ